MIGTVTYTDKWSQNFGPFLLGISCSAKRDKNGRGISPNSRLNLLFWYRSYVHSLTQTRSGRLICYLVLRLPVVVKPSTSQKVRDKHSHCQKIWVTKWPKKQLFRLRNRVWKTRSKQSQWEKLHTWQTSSSKAPRVPESFKFLLTLKWKQ